MELRDKKAWLKKHGMPVRFDDDPDGSLTGVVWTTMGGKRYRGTGRTREEMWGHLYDVVKAYLWTACNDEVR